MLIFLILEDALHGLLNEEYNYYILFDITLHLNFFYIVQTYYVLIEI